MHEYYYWIALRNVCGIGTVLCKQLIERFGSPERVFAADAAALSAVEGMTRRTVEALQRALPSSDAARELELLAAQQIGIVTYADPAYPALLRHIYDPPPLLYVRGTMPAVDECAVAIVGSRNASGYGRRVTDQISRDLAAQGITIVSGMARGIDACAHQGALAAGGRTIAVLGCGVDVVYPPEHKKLYAAIIEQGAVVSEYPPGTEPNGYHFPARNRIISGIARGVLVVEASPSSGSLITARCALEQGRDVYAVPGSIFAHTSKGANRLLRSGAKPVEAAQDILEELQPQAAAVCTRPEEPLPQLTAEQEALLRLLSEEPVHIDTLTDRLRLQPGRIAALLLELELQGVVTELPGKHFARSSRATG